MTHCMLEESLPALAVELPEDVARLKAGGDWKRAERVIRKRLEKDLPKALRERLLLELEILERIPGEYPFAWDEAVKEAQGMFRDFTGEELEALLEEGAVEWIYLDGTIHLKDNFVANLVKTRADLTDRAASRTRRSSWRTGAARNPDGAASIPRREAENASRRGMFFAAEVLPRQNGKEKAEKSARPY